MEQIERFFQRGLKLNHLRLLSLFATLGQIRLVAERLNVTQPAISKQIAEIEAGLGAAVLTRVGNRLQFTPLGESLLRYAREILLQLEQARHEVDALCSGISGTLTVGAVVTVLPVVAPILTLQLKNKAPNAGLRFIEATSDKLFPMLEAGELDFVFSRTAPAGLHAPDTMGQPMLNDPLVIVCGQGHPLATRRGLVPVDLAGVPWILPPRESPSFMALEAWMRRHGLSFPEGCVQTISLTASEALMKSYNFLGLMSLAFVRRGVSRGSLKILKLNDAVFLGDIWLFHKRAAGNPIVAAALECMPAVQETLRSGTD